MKVHYSVVFGLIILALISMAGVCAAEETTTDANLTDGSPLTPPLPDITMTSTMSEADRTGFQYGMPGDMEDTNSTIGADNPLYGLRIAFEDLDESFTFNNTERLEKRIRHGNSRFADFLNELAENKTDAADTAFGMYREKMNQTEDSLNLFRPNETGLLHAQEMITKHQEVLAALLEEHPDNRGLARAYNNSQQLERKFQEKTRVRFKQAESDGNTSSLRPVMIENPNSMGNGNGKDNRGQQNNSKQQDRAADLQQSGQNGQGSGNQQDKNTEQQPGQNGQGNRNNDRQNGNQQPKETGGQRK